jgi:hypothetical protein
MNPQLKEYTVEDIKPDLKGMLNDFCYATSMDMRRVRLEAILRKRFGSRLVIERKEWPFQADAWETINYLVVFGEQKDHLVIGAHYDAVSDCPGANDNGAAVIQLIEAATVLQDSGKEPNITFCFFDHEEIFGSEVMGSKVYTQMHKDNLPLQAIIFDVTGIGTTFFVSGYDDTGLVYDLPSRKTPPSDNLNMIRMQIPTALVCALPEEDFYEKHPATWNTLHTQNDSPEDVWDEALDGGVELLGRIVNRFTKQQAGYFAVTNLVRAAV